ncbi:hypothetical protein BMR31_01960 [Escherichia coli]|nr:hypothetical protein BMR31_01960 [Escherichia coli]
MAASQLHKKDPEGNFTVVVAGKLVILVSELAATMQQIKEFQRLPARKRWCMNFLKKPLNMDEKKEDSVRYAQMNR